MKAKKQPKENPDTEHIKDWKPGEIAWSMGLGGGLVTGGDVLSGPSAKGKRYWFAPFGSASKESVDPAHLYSTKYFWRLMKMEFKRDAARGVEMASLMMVVLATRSRSAADAAIAKKICEDLGFKDEKVLVGVLAILADLLN